MKGAKQILLAGFAALCMVLPACHTAIPGEEFARRIPLVISSEPLNTVSYTAEYTQAGLLPFTCEVKLASDNRIRRDYVWKDEKGAEKKVSVVIDGEKAVRLEDGKSVPLKDADAAQAKFFAGLILSPDSIVSNASRETGTASSVEGEDAVVPGRVYALELAGVPGVSHFIVATDPENDRWSRLAVRMVGDSHTLFATRFQEYKSESGVTYPSSIVSSTEGGAPVTCVIRDVKINPELPDELFRLPETNG